MEVSVVPESLMCFIDAKMYAQQRLMRCSPVPLCDVCSIAMPQGALLQRRTITRQRFVDKGTAESTLVAVALMRSLPNLQDKLVSQRKHTISEG
jgi:hypothetical protein